MPAEQFTAEERVIFGKSQDQIPSLRLLHYNDVYHVDSSSAEPVGGIARFMTLIKEYRDGEKFKGQPVLVSLFSGDAWNPSLESSVTKGTYNTESQHIKRARIRRFGILEHQSSDGSQDLKTQQSCLKPLKTLQRVGRSWTNMF